MRACARAGSTLLGRPGPELVSYFAATVPGLGPLLRDELGAQPGLEPAGEPGFDGRADIVLFRVHRGTRLQLGRLRLAEDVFAQVGSSRAGPAQRVAAALIPRDGLERALSVWAGSSGHLSPAMTFRVITRVTDESQFQRTQLRGAVERVIAAARPRWRHADPADLEVWVAQNRRDQFVSGLRLSGPWMRRRGSGRAAERHGALRPVVAAAMVGLAGDEPGRLLDPCCGSGTIAAEALAVGWQAWASDADPGAVATAAANVPRAAVAQADARDLPHGDGEFSAVVTNIPFGRQFRLAAERSSWVRAVLREAARVTRPGGRVVVLAPPPVGQAPAGLQQAGSYPVRLLGVPARIWVFDRQ